jgi:hypothetical protein
MTVRGTWPGAPTVRIEALEATDKVGSTGPYQTTEFARKLWLENENLADDRFEREGGDEDVGILVGMDQMFNIMFNEPATISPCGLRAYTSKLGKVIGGPSQEKSSKQNQTIVSQLLINSNRSLPQITSQPSKSIQSNKSESRETGNSSLLPLPENSEQICFYDTTKENKRFEMEKLNFDLSLFWRLENFANLNDCVAVEKDDQFRSFCNEITRFEDGRYCTPIPWTTDRWRLEINHQMAATRLRSMLSKLRKSPVDLANYTKEINQLIANGFVEEADFNYDGLHTYLPHHPVYRTDKATTKIRPVFDGAARSKYGPSLNDVLETGPNLNPDLLSVLMRFRMNRIAWIADIEKAFLNIALQPEDAEAVRFLWPKEPKNPDSDFIAYKWKRVPFGLSSSPFLLRVTINKHLLSVKSRFPSTVEQIEENLYVDDYLGGADIVPTAITTVEETVTLFSEAQLNMRSWATNNKELRDFLTEKEMSNQIVGILSPTIDGQHKALGLRWDTSSDSFKFDPTSIMEAAVEIGEKITKRKILSISARIFDPIGFLAPTVLLLKIIYQKLWEGDIGWDDDATPEVKNTWSSIMKGLKDLHNLEIPRWIGYSKPSIVSAEIHVFGDASEAAYGAVAYARLQLENGTPYTILLASKTRVAPLPKKKVTLPRLELLSSLLAIRLGEKIRTSLHTESWKTIYWTDSLVTLGWIRGDPYRWRPFVRNQVETIRQFSNKEWWRHCPGLENPADLASRGAPAHALVDSKLWWHGPAWLTEEESEWPNSPENHSTETQEKIEEEETKKTATVSFAAIETAQPMEWHLEKISTWTKLLFRTAWINRALNRMRKRTRGPGLELKEIIIVAGEEITIDKIVTEELNEAELAICRQLQVERYPKAFWTLQRGLEIHPKEKIASLRPVWDNRDRLIRVTGRVALALRDRDIQPPILLPANHPVVTMLIINKHVFNSHTGVKTTLSELKEKYWIVKGRQQVRNVWYTCVKCQKLTSPPFRQIAAPLPANRLRDARAFEITGTDFAGPLYYKNATPKKKSKSAPSVEQVIPEPPPEEENPDAAELPTEEAPEEEDDGDQLDPAQPVNKKQPKSYVCIFTCAVTRAIHLELTKDMTARSFLLAFRRFSARRGPVSVMYSDNAQTFRCVSRFLKNIRSDPSVHDLLAMRRTSWIFSVSLAPWWGGFWERMVRITKDLLRRSNGRACLAYDELEVSLIETESVINARPLNYIGEGADDPLPITPNQFLNNRRSTCATPEPAVNLLAPDSTSELLKKMDQNRRDYVSDLCSRFVSDYLMQLDNFHAKGSSGRKIRVGEVVVIHDKLSKRLMWETGVVKELLPSCDGLVRSAIVKFPNGKLLTRAIQCLYPVELREDQPEDVEIADGALNPEPAEATAPQIPNPPDPAPLPLLPIDPAAVEEENPVANPAATDVGEVESQGMGSGGEYVGNERHPQRPTTRSGRTTRIPAHLREFDLRGPR